MPDSMVQLFTKQYEDSLELALQQTDSRFMDKFMSGSHTGKGAAVLDMLDAVSMRPVSGAFEPMGRVAQNYTRRWLAPGKFDLPLLVDQFEQLESSQDPKSALVQATRAAIERQKDDMCIAAFFGDALTGTDGTTTTSWATEGANQVVAVTVGGGGSATGLNVEKLRAARKILKKNEVDFDREQVFLGYNAEADDDLLGEAQIISREYNERLVLKDGRIEYFMGFSFVPTERLPVDGSSYRRLPVWTKSGMHFGTWMPPKTSIDQRKDLQGYPWQVYTMASFNATRRDAKRIVEIKISE